MYKHPGVYIEHVPSGALSIEAASTSIACFIGPVLRGPVDEPVMILNRGDFARQFGELDDGTSGIRDLGDAPDYFGYAVNAFYDNGGRQAYVVRIAKDDANEAKGALEDPDDGANGLFFTAKNPGRWGNKLRAKIDPVDEDDAELGYLLELGYDELQDDGSADFVPVESFSGLSMDSGDANYVVTTLANRSDLVSCLHETVGASIDSAEITAVKGTPMPGFDIATVASRRMNVTINGAEYSILASANLIDIEVTLDRGGPGELVETHTLAAAMTDFDSFVAGLIEAVNAHSTMAGFSAYLSPASELILVPPANGPDPAVIDVTGGSMRTHIGLLNGAAIDYPAAGQAEFLSGTDGSALNATDYDAAFATLQDYRNASIILLPGMTWDTAEGAPGAPVIQKAITHAEFMQNRVVIVDPKDPGQGNALTTGAGVKSEAFPTSTFSALYYPWMKVNNPHYDADTKPNRPITHVVPPSAIAAGMWARIDGTRGVWKAPAGLEATVRGVQGPNILIGNDLQDQLNEWGVNCVRNIIGPPVIWGARTLATKTKPDQRYVPVRRTSAMIGESLYNALQAVVFEPNKHTLWASLRASTGDFMESLFRAGAFQGEKASQAYYVQCGLGQTMTQADIDSGIVRLVVGYAPLKPAEFVVVQIKQIVGQTG